MKKRAFALALALAMVLTALPGFAAPAELQPMPEPILAPAALPDRPAAPQAKTYAITMTSTGHGVAELYAASAGALERVYFLADPEPGYRVSFDKCGYYKKQHDMGLRYIGGNVYEIVMPDGDVILDLEFVKITTDSHRVTVAAGKDGRVTMDRTSARAGESVFLDAVPTPGYSVESVRAKCADGWAEGYYLGSSQGTERYEIFMPDSNVELRIAFKRNGPYTIRSFIDSRPAGGTVKLSRGTAYELETVTVTATPDRGYSVAFVVCGHSKVTKVSETVWTFPMPNSDEEVHVTFAPVVYPVRVALAAPMGGSAYLDAEGAVLGKTVTLTCIPEEGYRVAQITGVKVTEVRDNTYTFVMPDQAVKLTVLFLRQENPFLDVNETHFYHDPVLWALEEGVTNGVDATHFGPMTACNRAQVVTFLWRAAGSPAPVGRANPFTDVPAGVWYTDAVLWALEEGVTNGVDGTHFGPNATCNRAQVVTFLHRANGSPAPRTETNPFRDVAEGSFYRDAVLWALENNVTTGVSGDTFNPNGPCLRAQTATFLYRAAHLPEPKPDPLPFPDLG